MSAVMNWYTTKIVNTAISSKLQIGNRAKCILYHRLTRVGNQWINIPNTNKMTTYRYSHMKLGIILLFHAPPIWLIMFLVVSHACWLAKAGSKLLLERKNNRGKVMKTKV